MLSGGPLFEDLLLLVLLPVVAGILLTEGVGNYAKRHGRPPIAVRSLRILLTVLWTIVAGFGLVRAFGPFSFLSTLTASAIAGLAVTLALQTTLQNILAGFLLLRSRFLRVGDVVVFGGVKGTVAHIGLVTVVLKAEDGTLTSLSNSTMLSGPMTNYTATKRLAGEY